MKKIALIAILLAITTSPAGAEIKKGQFELSPTFGSPQAKSEFNNGAGAGTSIGMRIGYNLSNHVSLGLSANHNSFGADAASSTLPAGTLPAGGYIDLDANEFFFDTRMLIKNQPNGSPYVKGMLGAISFDIVRSVINDTTFIVESKNHFSYGAAAGYLITSEDNNFTIFMEASYVRLTTSHPTVSYLALRAGFSLFLGRD